MGTRGDDSAAGTGGTRRRFLGGAAALGAARLLTAAPAALAAPAPCAPSPPGVRTGAIAVTPDGGTVWTADSAGTTITAHRGRRLARGRSIDVGGAPIDLAVSPDGHRALVVCAVYDRPGLAIVDLLTGEVDHVPAGPEPRAVAFTPDGRSAYVAGGGREGTLTRVNPRSGHVHAPVALGSHPRGLAIAPDGDHALVALNGDSALALVTLATRRVRRIATRPFPHAVAIAPDGKRALVTHDGFGDTAITPVDLVRRRAQRRVRVGAELGGVAYSASGRQAIVAATGARAAILLDGRSGRRRSTVKQIGRPRHVAVAGGRAIVADGATGRLVAIRLGAGR